MKELHCFNTVNGRYCCNKKEDCEVITLSIEFQYRKRQVLLQQANTYALELPYTSEFQYRKRQVLLQLNKLEHWMDDLKFQYRKRQVLLQLTRRILAMIKLMFQYRKRQVLLQLGSIRELRLGWCSSFNTVNGRYCCNKTGQISETGNEFQYRKRQVLLQQRVLESQYSWGLKIGFRKPHTVNGQNMLPFGS